MYVAVVSMVFADERIGEGRTVHYDSAEHATVVEWAIEEDGWQKIEPVGTDGATYQTHVNAIDNTGVYCIRACEREETPTEQWIREGQEEIIAFERSSMPF